jgi:hypothetical protein
MLAIIVFVNWSMSSSRFVGNLSLDTRVWMAINEKITDYEKQEDSKDEGFGLGRLQGSEGVSQTFNHFPQEI